MTIRDRIKAIQARDRIEAIQADDDRLIEIMRELVAEDWEAAASVLDMMRGAGGGKLLRKLMDVRIRSEAELEEQLSGMMPGDKAAYAAKGE